MLRLRNRDQAEDAVQEALLAALENLDRFAGNASLATWVVGILRHKIIDSVRSGVREEPIEPEYSVISGEDPEDRLRQRRFLHGLERKLQGMPPNTARVFILREVIGMEVPEICQTLAISANNCAVILHRARYRLRMSADLQSLAADAV
jgi:RNA polymerase sigma-70 factor, ECF subfamily